MTYRRSRVFLGLAVSCFGCEATEPADRGLLQVTNETEWAVIAGPSGDPLCRGDELFVDRQLERLQAELGVQIEEKVAINVYTIYPVPGCSSGGLGCFDHGLINTGWEALPHELVHGVAAWLGGPADFWEEGLAEAISGARTERGDERVVDSVDKDNRDLSHLTAGHFVRWLIESRGIERFVDLYTGGAFDVVYGASLAEIEEEFDLEGPWSYPPLDSCDLPALTRDVDGRYDETLEIDCEDSSGSRFDGFIPSVSTRRAFEVEQNGEYDLEVTGGTGVHIFKCQTSVLLEETDEREAGDVYTELKYFPFELPWASGQTHTLTLEAGKHRMTIVAGEGRETDTVRVTLVPAE